MTAKHRIPRASALSGWRKSSYSGGDEGSCVEVLDNLPAVVPVRDSKNPDGPALVFGEVFSPARYAGMALILVGLAVIVLPSDGVRTPTPAPDRGVMSRRRGVDGEESDAP